MEVRLILEDGRDEGITRLIAEGEGHRVSGATTWNGPVPDGSFENVSATMRMSTAEFFFLRKANELPFAKAVQLGMELCGSYVTNLTAYALDGCELFVKQRTSKKRLRKYLKQIGDTDEGKKALSVLKWVRSGSLTPMDTYLYTLLCLPRKHGGAGLPKAHVSTLYNTPSGRHPGDDGDYLAYDLLWPERDVAVQYIGDDALTPESHHAICAGGTYPYYITKAQLEHDLQTVVEDVCALLGKNPPKRGKARLVEPPAHWHTLTTRDLL